MTGKRRLRAATLRVPLLMRADLLLVDGEPTRQIGDVRKVALVITQAAVITPNAVHPSLGIRPFVQDPPVRWASPPSAQSPQSSQALPARGGPGSAHCYHAH